MCGYTRCMATIYRGIEISRLNTTHEHWRTVINGETTAHDCLDDALIAIDRYLDRGHTDEEGPLAHSGGMSEGAGV